MMRKRKLFWRVFPFMLLISAISLAGVIVYASGVLDRFHRQTNKNHLRDLAAIVAAELEGGSRSFNAADMQAIAEDYARRVQARITAVNLKGEVLADSEENPRTMANHSDRPEIKDALATGKMGWATRYSNTLQRNMLYVALPVIQDGNTLGVVRTSRRLALVEESLSQVIYKLVVGGCAACVFAFLLSLWLTRSITRPLQQIEAGAHRFAQGDLTTHLGSFPSVELDGLARSVNTMADQLSARLAVLQQDHQELEAIVSSMIEGVMAVDQEEKVFRANDAAAKILGVERGQLVGKTLDNLIRNAGLEDVVTQALESNSPVEGEIVIHDRDERIIRVHGTQLYRQVNQQRGAVLVFNDISRLRRLERMRRQFASNVSHELKTPITSIQGYVETLLDGALENNPEDVRRFLDIILRQTKRLNAIMEDIMMLSGIEQDNGDMRETMGLLRIQNPIKGAVDQCRDKAAEKKIEILVACPVDLMIKAHPRLLEQAIVNLLGNAINYSPAGATVTVRVEIGEKELVIQVVDHGIGIPKSHLSRLFERFYRVDKARSRQMGGTGLGLAIAKHIMQIHGGRVDVESTPGKGSVFSLILPFDPKSGQSD